MCYIHSVDVHRRKQPTPRLPDTVRGVGYCWNVIRMLRETMLTAALGYEVKPQTALAQLYG